MRVRVEISFRPGEPDDAGRRYFVTIDEIKGEPAVELEVDKSAGHLVATAVTVRRARGVASRDIRIPIDRYLEVVSMHPALKGAHAQQLRPRRRLLSDDFLSDVADAYIAGGNSVAGISDQADHRFIGAADSTKFRWVKAARDRGLLPPREAD